VTPKETESETQIFLIDPRELHPNPVNVDIYGEEEVDLELVDSIRELGQLDPIVITYDKIIISGHRRWLALLALKDSGIKAKCLYKHFKTKLEEKEAIIECNRQREKTWIQICNEVDLLTEIYAEKADKRRLANLKQNTTESPNSASREESGSTRDYIEKNKVILLNPTSNWYDLSKFIHFAPSTFFLNPMNLKNVTDKLIDLNV
jgi:hypothetical protein